MLGLSSGLDLKEKLDGGRLVGDGAMGTPLTRGGVARPCDGTGARGIGTNTYATNAFKLQGGDLQPHGRGSRCRDRGSRSGGARILEAAGVRDRDPGADRGPGREAAAGPGASEERAAGGVLKRLAELSNEDAPKYGVEVAQSLVVEEKPLVGGAYLMPPASIPHLAGDVVEPIVEGL